MRWEVYALSVAIVLCLALPGIAGAADIKCVWEPCGEKVVQSDVDAVYALTHDSQIRIMFGDSDSDGIFDYSSDPMNQETVYVDMFYDPDQSNPSVVEAGDIRLSWYHTLYPPNTKVTSEDIDKIKLAEFDCKQAVVGFVDVNNNGVYDLADPLYVDTDCSEDVSVGDLRLTERIVNTQIHDAYTIVQPSDWDNSGVLLDPVTYLTDKTTPFEELVGYIDSDCSGDWTCPDKLYLQQLAPAKPKRPSVTDAVSDKFVTIGDLRLYIPPDAITNENWPSCGTKVEQADIDAVYILLKDDTIEIMFGDVNSDDEYDPGETIYVDMVYDPDGENNTVVEAGDVRLSAYHSIPANTKVTSEDNDRNDKLLPLPRDQMVIGFADVNNNGVYDLSDPIYVDTDGDCKVSVGDIRLTEREAMGVVYPAYSMVENGDFDALLNEDLFDLVTGTSPISTSFADLVGFIDSDCSHDWTCPDKLYLQQIVCDDEVPVPTDSTDEDRLYCEYECIADDLVTIGDFRLYIPPDAIANENWPECGTKVMQCDVDAVYTLTKDWYARVMFHDADSDHIYDIGESIYADMTHTSYIRSGDFYDAVEAGDIRLTSACDTYEPNTKVTAHDNDLNNKLHEFDCEDIIGFVDVNNDGAYDLGDPLYVDTDCNSRVSRGDLRLTEREASGMIYDPYTIVETGDWDLLGDTDLMNPAVPEPGSSDPLAEFHWLVGYIDSDCSGDWTCVDKLYLQQKVFCKEGTCCPANYVVTIGDLRLYIPPEEIVPPSNYNPYDVDEDGVIDNSELFAAIGDWKAGSLDNADLFDIIGYWKAGSYM